MSARRAHNRRTDEQIVAACRRLAGDGIPITIRALALELHISDSQLRVRVERLVDAGVLERDGGTHMTGAIYAATGRRPRGPGDADAAQYRGAHYPTLDAGDIALRLHHDRLYAAGARPQPPRASR